MSKEIPPSAPPDPSFATIGPDAMASGEGSASEIERMRAMLEVLYEGNPDGVCYADAQGTMIFNQAAMQIVNMNRSGPDTSGVENWAQNFGCFLDAQAAKKPQFTNLTLTRGDLGQGLQGIVKC